MKRLLKAFENLTCDYAARQLETIRALSHKFDLYDHVQDSAFRTQIKSLRGWA